jgi:hypothetical protein
MKSKYLPVCLLTILFAMYLAGCAAEAFKIAQEDNTIAAYEQFLREYGDSEFVPQATKSIEDIKFQKIKERNTIFGYDLYIKEYPDGSFVSEVNRLRLKKESEEHLKQGITESSANGDVNN